jgi:HEAT repeat protein
LCGGLFVLGLVVPRALGETLPYDSVQALKRALQQESGSSPEALKERQTRLRERIKDLHTIGELGRALQLQGWRDEAIDRNVRDADRAVREELAKEFADQVRDALQGSGPYIPLAAANLVGEFASLERTSSTKSQFILDQLREFAPSLIELTKADDSRLREASARALSNLEAPPERTVAAFERLLSPAREPNVAVRRVAAESLNNLVRLATGGDRKGIGTTGSGGEKDMVAVGTLAVPVAVQGLSDVDAQVRLHCIESIRLTTLAVVEPLESRVQSQPGDRSMTADEEERLRKAQRVQEEALLPLLEQYRDHLVELARAAADPVPAVRVVALNVLEDLGKIRQSLPHPGDRESFRTQPDHPERQAQNRPTAVVRVAYLASSNVGAGEDVLGPGLRQVLPALTTALVDRDPQVRLAAAEALEMYGPLGIPAIPQLVRALGDRNLFVRWVSARTLGKLAPNQPELVVPGLVALLPVGEDLDVRLTAMAALENYGTTSPQPISPALRDAVPALARAAVTGDSKARVAAIRALAAVGIEAAPAVPSLAKALSDPHSDVRQMAAQVLGRLGPAAKAATPDLLKALRDSDPQVRGFAGGALLRIQEPK